MSGAIQLSAADFPGYAAAVARENLVRAAACLGLPERVCGLPVEPLTLRRIRLLALASSPFLIRGITAEQLAVKPGIDEDIKSFFAIVWEKPVFTSRRPRMRREWIYRRHVQPMVREGLNQTASGRNAAGAARWVMEKICSAILEYIEEAYLDAPADEEAKSYYAAEVSIAASFNRTYGLPIDFWSDQTTGIKGSVRRFYRWLTGKISPVDVPLKIIWQLQKAERHFHDAKGLMSNPSDKLLAEGLAAYNKKQAGASLTANAAGAADSPIHAGEGI